MRKLKLLSFFCLLFMAGSVFSQPSVILNEGFEGGVLPAGWTTQYVSGTTDWLFNVSGGYLSHPAAAHSGSYNARFFINNYTQPKAFLITPKLDLSSVGASKLKFWHTQELWPSDQDTLKIYCKVGASGAWTHLITYDASIASWQLDSIDLSAFLVDSVYVGFEGGAHYGYGICLDDITVEVTPPCADVYSGQITPALAIQATPYSAGTRPFWKFHATAGLTYYFTMCENTEDSYLRIFDNNFNQLAYADDNGPYCNGLPASIGWECLSDGDYYVAAMHWDCNGLYNSGNFEYYYMEARTCESCSPADAVINTFPVQYDAGYYIQGTMGNAGKLTALFHGKQGKVYHFDLCPSTPGDGWANFDVDIKITDSLCNILTGEDGNCSVPNTYRPNDFSWTCPADDYYFVVLAPYLSYNRHQCIGDQNDSIIMYFYIEPPVLTCPPGATPENEPLCVTDYVDATNGGCNSTPNVFTEITDSCSQTFCSQSGTYIYSGSNYRDTDWYRLLLTRQRIVKWEVAAEFPFYAFILDGNSGCSSTIILAQGMGDAGDTVAVIDTLAAGTYYLWVGPSMYTGIPAGMDYFATYSVIGYEPNAAGAITGTATVCSGSTNVSYSVTAIPGISEYEWTYSGTGATINGTGNNITIDFAPNATNGILSVRGFDGCLYGSPSPNYAIVILPLPAAAGAITGPASVCAGTSGSFSTPVITNAVSYTWTYSGTGANITGSSNTINISFAPNATSGVLRVKGHNNCGDGTISPDFQIVINPSPGAAGTIIGTPAVCAGTSGVAYSIPPITAASSYIWAYSGTGVTINGSGTDITLDFSAGATNGNLTVRGTNSCGNGAVSANFPINILHLPSAAGTITGQTSVCQGNMSVVYTVPVISGADSYLWTLPTGFAGGSTTNSVTVNIENTAVSDTIFVYGTNTCGQGTSAYLYVTVNALPGNAGSILGPSDVCWADAGVVYSVTAVTNATSYSWNYTGTGAVLNGTGNNVTIDFPPNSTSGELTVSGQNACGNGGVSAVFNITVDPCNWGIPENGSSNISIRPNPNKGMFDIELTLNRNQICSVVILNSIGQKISENEYNAVNGVNTFKADLTGMSNGIYYVQINTGDDVFTRKVIISR